MAAEIPRSRRDSSDQAGAAEPPVDLDHLARQTGGDRNLEREVLTLFLTRSAIDLDRLKTAAAGAGRRDAAHLIVGSARAIGAGKVARLAAAVEQGADGQTSVLADLEAAVAEARRFVSDYLSG